MPLRSIRATDYSVYNVAGAAIGGKGKGEAENEEKPVDLRRPLP